MIYQRPVDQHKSRLSCNIFMCLAKPSRTCSANPEHMAAWINITETVRIFDSDLRFPVILPVSVVPTTIGDGNSVPNASKPINTHAMLAMELFSNPRKRIFTTHKLAVPCKWYKKNGFD